MLNRNLLTEYGKNIDTNSVLQEYPRPQLKRDSYVNLNGFWDYQISDSSRFSGSRDGEILVPFPLESCLSRSNRVGEPLKEDEHLIYRREFVLEKDFLKDVTLLHVGAVDCICEVYINDEYAGQHKGGYLPATFDISKSVAIGSNIVEIVVTDGNSYMYPTGKQRFKRGGIWYTPISGIWQTVWLESVPKDYIEKINYYPDLANKELRIEIEPKLNASLKVAFEGKDFFAGRIENGEATVRLEDDVHLWSPDVPNLYDVTISTESDEVSSYFAMREFKTNGGMFYLNGKPIFLNAVLDQGYFSDGIYTPASYELYKEDILNMKKLGFNALRKHIKIEPMVFYHYCDKLGMLVMQDMVNVGKYSFIKDTILPFGLHAKKLPYVNVNKRQQENFKRHSVATVKHLFSVPSVVYYTIFNEGWGQSSGDKMFEILYKLDPTRVYDSTSGWFHETKSDVLSEHIYFKPIKPAKLDGRPWIVSEFGGYSLPIEPHLFNNKRSFGYKGFKDESALQSSFEKLYEEQIIGMVKNGLAGAVYTQLSDVEDEINGILTYDRKVLKLDEKRTYELMQKLYREFESESN